MQRVILHCDMNNFYAYVECMLNPELVYAEPGTEEQAGGSVRFCGGTAWHRTCEELCSKGVWRFHGRGNLASKAEVPGSCDRGAAL